MTYQLTETGSIKRNLEDGATLFLPPENNGTPEWRAYQEWLDAGNTPEPAPPPPPPPAPRSPREKLEALGLTVGELKQLINGPEETVLVRARNQDGTFAGDNPATPQNEAYVEVPISKA